jgi:CRP/FNR family transcriptional regulator, nitrogen fixation regulation protein
MYIAPAVPAEPAPASLRTALAIEHTAMVVDGLPGRAIRHDRGSSIYDEGSPATHIYQVLAGVVRTCKLLPDGRRQIGGFAFAGEIFGLDGSEVHFYAAEAVTDCSVIRYSRRAIEAMQPQNRVGSGALQKLMLDSLAAAQRCILALGRKTAVERVAWFLLELEERGGSKCGRVDLPMPRHDIADHLGLTMETVSRAFGILKRSGAVALDGAHQVQIRNNAVLQEFGGELLRLN